MPSATRSCLCCVQKSRSSNWAMRSIRSLFNIIMASTSASFTSLLGERVAIRCEILWCWFFQKGSSHGAAGAGTAWYRYRSLRKCLFSGWLEASSSRGCPPRFGAEDPTSGFIHLSIHEPLHLPSLDGSGGDCSGSPCPVPTLKTRGTRVVKSRPTWEKT